MDLRRVRAAIGHRDAGVDVFGIRLGVFDLNVEVALLQPLILERIEQFVFADTLAAAAVRAQQVLVGKGGVRVLVDHGRVGVRRQVVGVEPVVLDVFAVIAFLVGQTVGPLFENRVLSVP